MNVNVPAIHLIMSIAEAVDLMNVKISNHHKRVACIAYHLGTEVGLTESEKENLTYAAALHDIGSLTLDSRLNSLVFDFEDSNYHAEKGYLLLKSFKPFTNIADLVRYHHTAWDEGRCAGLDPKTVPYGSHLLNLADRISTLIRPDEALFSQAEAIRNRILKASGTMFKPELVDAFMKLSQKESFWLDTVSSSLSTFLERKFEGNEYELEGEDFLGLIKLFSRIIDFRSRFTSTHSSGVAATGEAMAKLAGFSERDIKMMRIAGYIHDLGKLAVPPEILEKPGSLTEEEYGIIRTHSYYTDIILRPVEQMDTIRKWGAYHHERMDGKGYPFRLTPHELPMGSRIIAVCDVFVALTEDRPYRKGMTNDEVRKALRFMADTKALDPDVVSLITDHYDDINTIRVHAQEAAAKEYQEFLLDDDKVAQ